MKRHADSLSSRTPSEAISSPDRPFAAAFLIYLGLAVLFMIAGIALFVSKTPPSIFDPGPGTIYGDRIDATRSSGLVDIATIWLFAILLTTLWYVWMQRVKQHRSTGESVRATLVASSSVPIVTVAYLIFLIAWSSRQDWFRPPGLLSILVIMIATGIIFSGGLAIFSALCSAIAPRWPLGFVVFGLLACVLVCGVFWVGLAFMAFCC